MSEEQLKKAIKAEVILSLPNKLKILVRDINDFKVAEEKLAVGSYVRVYDHEDIIQIAIIESFSIEFVENNKTDTESDRKYIIEAIPLGIIKEGVFIRGGNNIAFPPMGVEPAKKEEIIKIYNNTNEESRFCFSTLAQDNEIEVPVDGDKFFNKHVAIVGSTGSGKSHTVAEILQEAIEAKTGSYQGLNNSHIIIFDIHSEYKEAFPKANYIDVESLVLPYWLLNSEELQDLFIESNEEQSHNQVSVLKRSIVNSKVKNFVGDGELKEKINYDSPVMFKLEEILDFIRSKNEEMVPGARGDKQGNLFGKLDNFINRLEAKIEDKRLNFLFGDASKNISFEESLRQFLGYKKDKEANVTIIDLSGVPFEVLSITVSLISRLLFEYGYYYKKINQDKQNKTPIHIVYEEAHKYVPKNTAAKYTASRNSIERIAKEGRKYGVTLMIVSQRPSEISETIFSQCSNFVSMRLTNPEDQNYVKRLLPDTLGPLTESLPTLQCGEALLIGDSVVMPSNVLIKPCKDQPSSNNIAYLQEWKKEWHEVEFKNIIEKWQK